MTTVVNKYHICITDPDVVYIGRGSIWGNPYSHKEGTKAQYRVNTREEAIESYRHWLWKEIQAGRITIPMLLALDGKRLACYCKPQSCHGDIIVAAIQWAKKENI